MIKEEFFAKLIFLTRTMKYLYYSGVYWQVFIDRTIRYGAKIITWDEMYTIYNILSPKEQNNINIQLNRASYFSNYKNVNLLIKTFVKLAKKYNFYNSLVKHLKPEDINKDLDLTILVWNGCTSRITPNLLNCLMPLKLIYEIERKVNIQELKTEFNYEIFLSLKQDIIDFLNEHKVYDTFITYIKTNLFNTKSIDDYAKYISSRNLGPVLSFLSISDLNWYKLKGGCEFWNELHKNFVNKMIDKLITPL